MRWRSLRTEPRVITLVDTCVLLDILTDDANWADWSANALADARDAGILVINPIIYAEMSAGFDTIEELDDALPTVDFARRPLPYEAGFIASRAFLNYRKRGGERRSPLPDFYIGAHAGCRSIGCSPGMQAVTAATSPPSSLSPLTGDCRRSSAAVSRKVAILGP